MSPATFAPTPDYDELVLSRPEEQTPQNASVSLGVRLAALRELNLHISQPPPFQRVPGIAEIEGEIPELVWPTVAQIEAALDPLYAHSEAEVNIDALRAVMVEQLTEAPMTHVEAARVTDRILEGAVEPAHVAAYVRDTAKVAGMLADAPQSPLDDAEERMEGDLSFGEIPIRVDPTVAPGTFHIWTDGDAAQAARDAEMHRQLTATKILHALQQAPRTPEMDELDRKVMERLARQSRRIQEFNAWRQPAMARELDRIERTIAGLQPPALVAGRCTGHGDCEADVHYDCLGEWLTDAELAANVVPSDEMLLARQALTMWGEVPS